MWQIAFSIYFNSLPNPTYFRMFKNSVCLSVSAKQQVLVQWRNNVHVLLSLLWRKNWLLDKASDLSKNNNNTFLFFSLVMNFNILFLLFHLPPIGKPKFTGEKRQYTPEQKPTKKWLIMAFIFIFSCQTVLYGIPDSTFRDRFKGAVEVDINQHHQTLMGLDLMFLVAHHV